MRSTILRMAFQIARQPLIRPLVPWMFQSLNFAIPLQRLRETGSLQAFYHPAPVYPVHILIIPRRAVASLETMDSRDEVFMIELFGVVQSLVSELGLAQKGYRLIVNGGSFQDLPLLHFHLVSGEPADRR